MHSFICKKKNLSNKKFKEYIFSAFYLIFLQRILIGGLAHLARALAWHARGGRFESDILHQPKNSPLIDFKGLFCTLKQGLFG